MAVVALARVLRTPTSRMRPLRRRDVDLVSSPTATPTPTSTPTLPTNCSGLLPDTEIVQAVGRSAVRPRTCSTYRPGHWPDRSGLPAARRQRHRNRWPVDADPGRVRDGVRRRCVGAAAGGRECERISHPWGVGDRRRDRRPARATCSKRRSGSASSASTARVPVLVGIEATRLPADQAKQRSSRSRTGSWPVRRVEPEPRDGAPQPSRKRQGRRPGTVPVAVRYLPASGERHLDVRVGECDWWPMAHGRLQFTERGHGARSASRARD